MASRFLPAFFGLACVAVRITLASDEQQPPPVSSEPQIGPGSEALVYSVEALQGDDPAGVHLTGLRVSAGPWSEDEFYGRVFFWGAFQKGENQKVTSAGAEVAVGPPFGPFRLMPRFRLGFEHRAEPPDDGFAALAGIGLELNLWLGRHLQVAVSADRDFGFPSGTRDLVGLALRWGYVPKPVRLKDAAENGNLEAVQHLLQSGVRLEGPTAHEALYEAASHCARTMLAVLLDAWSGPPDNMTELSLRTVARKCEPDLVALLLERGADPNANYYLGGTVLMDAVEAGKTQAARLLIQAGADVNGQGRYESPPPKPKKHPYAIVEKECRATALMIAAGNGNAQLVNLLLDSGATPDLRDSHGCTAEEAARRAGHGEIAESIRNHAHL
jgi:hypothetical protein